MKHFEEQVSQAAPDCGMKKQSFACTGNPRRSVAFLGMGGYAGGRSGRSVVGSGVGTDVR